MITAIIYLNRAAEILGAINMKAPRMGFHTPDSNETEAITKAREAAKILIEIALEHIDYDR